MKKFLVACCLCLFLVTLSNGCVTRTTYRGVTNTNRLKNNKATTYHIPKKTFWIWQKGFWSHH
ncbi:MAG: hypothetical protein PH343_05980 [Nitrospira sp.]|nr:hypothetical protein [Nitrospira sp.]